MDIDDLKLPDGMKFPADWRPIDIENAKTIALLVAKVESLEKRVVTNAEVLKDLCAYADKIRESVVEVGKDQLYLDDKIDEAYYHLFPERYEQDRRFEKQVRNLTRTRKPKDGADPKDA